MNYYKTQNNEKYYYSDYFVKRSLRFSRVACCIVTLISMLSALGWIFNIQILIGVIPSSSVIQPNTIVGLFVSSISVFLITLKDSDRRIFRDVSLICAIFITLLGLLTLYEYYFEKDLGIDKSFLYLMSFRQKTYSYRPSPQASVNFALLGMGLLSYLGHPPMIRLGQFCVLASGTNAIVAMTGYIFSTSQYYGFPVFVPEIGMAIHSAFCFVLLTAALLSSHPTKGIMTLINSDSRTGAMTRKILLTSILAPIVIGIITLIGRNLGWYGVDVQASIFTLALVGIILRATWQAARQSEKEERWAKTLFDERQIFAAFIENSSDFIGIADPSGKPLYINPEGRRMVGLDLDYPIQNTKIPEYYPPEQRSFVENVIVREMIQKGHWKGETYFRNWKTQESIPVSDEHFLIREGKTQRILGMGTITRNITEINQMRENLQAVEEMFKSVIETAPDAFIIVNSEGIIEVVNRQVENWFGYSREELLGKSIETLIPERDRKKHGILRLGFMAEPKTRPMGLGLELYARRKDGTEFPVEISLSPLETPRGLLVTSIIRDISEKKKSERVLRELNQNLEKRILERTEQLTREIRQRKESERIYRAIGESIDYGVWICSPDGRNTYASESFLKLVGLTQEECSEFGWGKVLHPDDAEMTIAAWKECVRTGGKWDIQHRFRGVDGRWHPILARGVPVKNEQGKILCWAGINLDIRALKETEEALKKSEESYRLTVESITDYAIFMLDPNGNILSWNKGAQNISGYFAFEMIGRCFDIFYPREEIKSKKPFQELKIAENQGKYEEESRRIRKDGSEFWANVVISAVRDEKGVLKGFTNVLSDITEKRKAALALKKANEILESHIDEQKRILVEREELLKAVRAAKDQLEQRVQERTRDLMKSNKELEQFAYIASHDLQTPLRHIASYVQLLISKIKKTTEIDPQTEKWIKYIIGGTQQMKSLISDLLTYSRVGRIDVIVEKIEMTKIIENVLEILKEPIRKSHAKIKIGELPEIFAVKSQMIQIFQNLLENAIKFKKAEIDPEIEIKSEDQGESWKFLITDNGIGLNLKYSERIFAMFQRLHTSEEYSGTGIGLAVCKKIVEFHGGKIGVNSEEGVGSTFYFSIPKKEQITEKLSREAA